MKSSYQVKWYGIQKMSSKTTNVAKLPKSLTKGAGIGVVHWKGVILTHSFEAAKKIKSNAAKQHRTDLLSFIITDKQFGLIDIRYNAPAKLKAPFKHGIFVKDGNRNIAIPVTLKQMQSNWIK